MAADAQMHVSRLRTEQQPCPTVTSRDNVADRSQIPVAGEPPLKTAACVCMFLSIIIINNNQL